MPSALRDDQRNLDVMQTAEHPEPPRAEVGRRLLWWKELLLIVAFYGIYTFARDQFGSATIDGKGQPEASFHNAERVIAIERFFNFFHEATIQSWFLSWHLFIRFWNVYYGSLHFIVTVIAFIWMFRRSPDRFPRWRNTLGFATALAIVGFSFFPLMPPRLLSAPPPYGGADLVAQKYHEPAAEKYPFEDTLEKVGGLWSFDSGTMKELSNQYAAMPSLHMAWSTWSVLVMWPLVKRKWARGLLVLYPIATLFCIVVTANHYFLDAVGGLVVLGLGYLLGTWLDDWYQGVVARRGVTATADR
jgi:hypothetical protein